MTPPITLERTFPAPAERIWEELTNPSQMKQWYFDIPGFHPEVGYEFSFTGGTEEKQYMHLCKVMEAVPLKKLKHSWRYEGYEGESFVTWELFPEGKGTRVRLTHEGLETFPPIKDFARANFEAGWNEIVGTSLKQHLEKESAGQSAR